MNKQVEYIAGENPAWKRKGAKAQDIVRPSRNIGSALGVSATHLDWTMVPYVRKSFWKHWKDGLKYIGGDPDFDIDFENSDDWKSPADIPIDDYFYTGRAGGLDHINDIEKVYKYAMDMTVKEVYQAVEGMYHNLRY